MLVGVELVSLGQRVLGLLRRRTLEYRANLMMGPMILGCRGLQKPLEQGHRGSDVLACPGEVWEGFVVLDDPPIHVVGYGTCMPTVSVALDLSLEPRAFLLELESCFFKLLVPRPQLLYPQARWAPASPRTRRRGHLLG